MILIKCEWGKSWSDKRLEVAKAYWSPEQRAAAGERRRQRAAIARSLKDKAKVAAMQKNLAPLLPKNASPHDILWAMMKYRVA
jgi:hypothetical protein